VVLSDALADADRPEPDADVQGEARGVSGKMPD